MTSKFRKNYIENGYLMNYKKGVCVAPVSNWVMLFKIEMVDIEPRIWRRIMIPSDYNFFDLHVAIQDAMGWLDYHLHYFEFKGKGKKKDVRIGIPDFDGSDDLFEIYPGWEIPVATYFKDLGVTAEYFYDYGDSWLHTMQLEAYFFKDKKAKYPLCIDGERACPPEDCGGVPGYSELIKSLSNPNNDNYEEMREWVGKDWNSEVFDKNSIRFDNPYKRWKNAFLDKGRI